DSHLAHVTANRAVAFAGLQQARVGNTVCPSTTCRGSVSREYFRTHNRLGALRYLLAQPSHNCNFEETVRMNHRMLTLERMTRLIGPGIAAATLLAACGGSGGSSGSSGYGSPPPSTPPTASNPPPTPTPTPTPSVYSVSKLVSDRPLPPAHPRATL